MREGATGRNLEERRDIGFEAPSPNGGQPAREGVQAVASNQPAVASLSIGTSGIPFGFSRVWAAYPQGQMPGSGGLVAFPFQAFSAGAPVPSSDQDTGLVSGLEFESPDPGHSLIQESFFICSVKGFGELAGLGKVYVEIAVDVASHLAFARVCGAPSPANAVNFLRTGVLPFYQRRGVRIERIFTRHSREFCGLMPTHPYELFLASAKIEHALVGPGQNRPDALSLQLYRILCQEFFAPEFRKSFQHSFRTLQRELDIFLAAYNRERALPDGAGPGQTPLRPSLGETSAAEPTKPGE